MDGNLVKKKKNTTVALLDISAQKRKSSEKRPEFSPKKQCVSWPMAASSDVSDVVYKGASTDTNKTFVTPVSRVPSTNAVSLYATGAEWAGHAATRTRPCYRIHLQLITMPSQPDDPISVRGRLTMCSRSFYPLRMRLFTPRLVYPMLI